MSRRPERRPEHRSYGDDRGREITGRDRERERSPSRHSNYHDRHHRRDSRDDQEYGHGSRPGNSYGSNARFSSNRGGYASATSNEVLPQLPANVPIPKNGREFTYKGVEQRGHAGRPLTVLTNHFVIQSLPIVKTYQYDVRMQVPASSQRRGNEKVSAMLMAKAYVEAKHLFGDDFVFDDVSIGWSTTKLCPVGEQRDAIIDLPGHTDEKPNQVEIAIRNSGPLNIRDFVEYLKSGSTGTASGDPTVDDCFKALNAVYRKGAARKFLSFPKSSAFFTRSPELSTVLQSTGGILEAIRGIYQTVSFTFGKLSLNVNTACTAFYCPDKPLLNLVQAFVGMGSLRDLERASTAEIASNCSRMIGVFFVVRHLSPELNKKKIRVQRFTPRNASETTFDQQDPLTGTSSTTTIEAYYRVKYAIKLQYPMLPLVDTRHGMFPLELCFTAAGERYREALQGSETADFIRFSTSPAHVRSRQIFDNVKRLDWQSQTIPQGMGLSVKPSMLELSARLLPAPIPIYGQGSDRRGPESGSWNLRGKKFATCAGFKSWGVLHFSGGQRRLSDQELKQFLQSLCGACEQTGLNAPLAAPAILLGNPHGDIASAIKELATKTARNFDAKPDILIFLLNQKTSIQIYKIIKNICEVVLGIPSQVMLIEKAFGKGGPQYQANISMKVNVKLGGVNASIDEPLFKKDRFMMLGGDSSHASPGELRIIPPPPSYSSLVGSYDASCVQYTGVATAQESTSEFIGAMKPMAAEILKRYKHKNSGYLPNRVIFWRDGIAESQVPAFMETEVKALKEARDECGKDFKITVVNCVKRHHTRLFPHSDRGDKLGNVLPGTIVENSSKNNDVFVVTQSALQGTCRPTHYTVLMDENHLTPDDFQRLIMVGCFTYARATRSVSIHSAVYYSDLVCERARMHMRVEDDGTYLKDVHDNLVFTMYWQ